MKKMTMRLLALPAILFTCAVLATGCNTIEGFGEDVEEGGEEVSEASRDVQD